jgi:hypothetical protein
MIATRDSAGTESMARSFRDPAEAVLRHRGRILRTVHRDNAAPMEKLISDYARIDLVAPRDSILARIVRGREAWYSNVTIAGFEAASASRSELVKSLEID